MTQDIIEMAREAGFCHDINNGIYLSAPIHLEAFAKLVASKEREEFAVHAVDIARRAIAEEREACAKICDDLSDKYSIGFHGSEVDALDEASRQILSRSQPMYEPCPFIECGCDGNHPFGQGVLKTIRARGD